jgi:hypothetical protein
MRMKRVFQRVRRTRERIETQNVFQFPFLAATLSRATRFVFPAG